MHFHLKASLLALRFEEKEKDMKIEFIKQLMSEFENSQVFKMKVEIDDLKLELEKEGTQKAVYVESAPVAPVAPVVSQPVQPVSDAAAPVQQAKGTEVTSPLVGTFYLASSPTSDPFVQVGDHVSQGQVVCIIEAMKVMNEIKAPVDGTVTSICVKNEETVEFGTVLMTIE